MSDVMMTSLVMQVLVMVIVLVAGHWCLVLVLASGLLGNVAIISD